MTETLDRLMAAAAMIGESSSPVMGLEHARGNGDAEGVVEEREAEVLLHVRTVAMEIRRAVVMARRSPLTTIGGGIVVAGVTAVRVVSVTGAVAVCAAGAGWAGSPVQTR